MLRQANQSVPHAFTLVETLVVIGIIGVLLGLLFPALASFRAESKSSQCLVNLRQLFAALETARQQRNDLLPFAAPIPLPPDSTPPGVALPGLPDVLTGIIPKQSETWMCPADDTQESEDLGTSYFYWPGLFMVAEPPPIPDGSSLPPTMDSPAELQRRMRLITQRYESGYLRTYPVFKDTDDYHGRGSRTPRNAVFIDGSARVVKATDDAIDIEHPDPNEMKPQPNSDS